MVFQRYIKYLQHDLNCDTESHTMIGQYIPPTFASVFGFTSFFIILYLMSPRIYFFLENQFSKQPRVFNQITLDQRSSRILSFVHHTVVSFIGFGWLYSDYAKDRSISCVTDYAEMYKDKFWTINFVVSYMGVDFFLNLKKKTYVYCVHHALVIFISFEILPLSGSLIRFIPHFFICESSSIIFILGSFLRDFGHKSTVSHEILRILFIVLFFVTRVLNFTALFYSLFEVEVSPFILVAVLLLSILQLFWFGKIIKAYRISKFN